MARTAPSRNPTARARTRQAYPTRRRTRRGRGEPDGAGEAADDGDAAGDTDGAGLGDTYGLNAPLVPNSTR